MLVLECGKTYKLGLSTTYLLQCKNTKEMARIGLEWSRLLARSTFFLFLLLLSSFSSCFSSSSLKDSLFLFLFWCLAENAMWRGGGLVLFLFPYSCFKILCTIIISCLAKPWAIGWFPWGLAEILFPWGANLASQGS